MMKESGASYLDFSFILSKYSILIFYFKDFVLSPKFQGYHLEESSIPISLLKLDDSKLLPPFYFLLGKCVV